MSENWFFDRTEAQSKPDNRGKLNLSEETMAKLTPNAVKSMNPSAATVNMQPDGSNHPDVYFLKMFPSVAEDEAGKPFASPGGRLIKSILPRHHKTRFGYAVRTTTPSERAPTEFEIAAFRKAVEDDIEATKPKVVVGLGFQAIKWALGKVTRTLTLRLVAGRYFPVRFGKHTCWFTAVEEPETLLEMLEPGSQLDWTNLFRMRVADRQIKSDAPIWRKRIDAAYKRAKKSPPTYITEAEALDGITLYHATGKEKDFIKLSERVNQSLAQEEFAFDIETHSDKCVGDLFRPYDPGAKIVCMSVADSLGTYSFMVQHPQESWGDHFGGVMDLVKYLFRSPRRKIAHNCPYEMEWAAYEAGWRCVLKGDWNCTQAQAYVLNPQSGGMSLHFLSTMYFGLKLKDVTGVDRTKPLETDPEALLRYNALDSKITLKLFHKQQKLIEREKLQRVYRDQMKRPPCFTLCQYQGLPVSQDENASLAEDFDNEIKSLNFKIDNHPLVKKYRNRFGSFNVDSPQQVLKLYSEIKKTAVGGSANEEALKSFGGRLGGLIIQRRKYVKLRATYVEPLELGSERCVVYPDNKVHCLYNATLTTTGRPSAESPNTLNYPKRSEIGKRCRQPFVAPDGHIYLSLDLGQAEYRTIGMASGDKVIIDSCFTDYDVHMEWAQRIAKAYPRILDKPQYRGLGDEKKIWKALRTDIKNQWVFPAFYGAALRSRESYLEVPEGSMERVDRAFWKTFHGVLDFQNRIKDFYATHGYVECLNGRRRYGPISPNELINTPIQGSAFEIAMDAHYRLCQLAVSTNKLYIAPRLNIYDDLTCIVPKSDADWCKTKMVDAMLGCKFKWVNVPLLAELSEGPNWKDLKEVGKFTSKLERK